MGIKLGDTYPHRIVLDLKAERQKSVDSTLAVCRTFAHQYKNDRGYDLIPLPNGSKTVVFTKKEYRIVHDDDGRNGTNTNNNNKKKKMTVNRRTARIKKDKKSSSSQYSSSSSSSRKRQSVVDKKKKEEKK